MIAWIEPVRLFHAACAGASLGLFLWRGMWMWCGRPVRVRLWRRTVPDTVDTALLASGIAMAVMLGISPLESGWLAVKLAAVVVYVTLGFFAFRGHGRWLPRAAWLLALMVFAYIVAVATRQQALPWVG
ncbi:MAG: SirB2 family protein [Mariprofundaceae bacterium]